MNEQNQSIIEATLVKELLKRRIEFRFFSKPPTSIFKVFRGRTIGHTITIVETFRDLEVTMDNEILPRPVFVTDILNRLGFVTPDPQPAPPNFDSDSDPKGKGKRRMRRIE